jgi:hypothetical protein
LVTFAHVTYYQQGPRITHNFVRKGVTMRRLLLVVAAAIIAVLVLPMSTAAAAPPPMENGPVSYSYGGVILSGTAKSIFQELIPYDPVTENWKYRQNLTATLTDPAGAVYGLTESYAYSHITKISKTKTTVTDDILWQQSLTLPNGTVQTGTLSQRIITVNGVITSFNSVNTPFPCEGPL